MTKSESNLQYTLADIKDRLPAGEVTIKGDPNFKVSGFCTIQLGQTDKITFLVNPLYKKFLSTTEAGAVILNEIDAQDCPRNALISKNPYLTFAKVATLFDKRSLPEAGIHSSAVVHETASIDPSASIGPRCVIGKRAKIGPGVKLGAGCVIGDDCELDEGTRLDANVTLYHDVKLAKRVLVASGTVIGSDGFGIAKDKGAWHKVPQLGRVVIQDDVEIGANCAIDRGAIDDTVIERGVKLDNLIQIGHNVRIGEHTAIAGCTGISGSAVIGKHCIIGGNAGFAGHIQVADHVVVTGKTSVTKSIREPGIYSSGVGGLMKNLEWKKNSARLQRLDSLLRRVKELEKWAQVHCSKESSEI